MVIEVKIPDLGGAASADVIAINVKAGDKVAVDDALITLEGDKASMDIPSPHAGTVKAVQVSKGDKVSEGHVILTLEAEGDSKPAEQPEPKSAESEAPSERKTEVKETISADKPQSEKAPERGTEDEEEDSEESSFEEAGIYAGPLVRRLAREFGVDLTKVQGSGRKGRIVKEDVQHYVKAHLSGAGQGAGGVGLNLAPAPVVDFSQWGEIEVQPLNKIKRLTGQNVHRAWVTIPHVTQFDEADITDLETFRDQHKAQVEKEGYKLTPLAFVAKAVAHTLKVFPTFNASLNETADQLILKKYCHLGIAVDTPNGLVVPVLQNADKKSVREIAKEMAGLGKKARDKVLMPKDMMGSTFTISSLGGIGGTGFTPIVNAPDVAILGVSKAKIKPVYEDGEFIPRLMLPLSLSYDHRVIDGAEAARFMVYLCQCLSDLRMLVL